MKDGAGPPELRDVNITVLDGREVGLDELTATCNTVPFLAEKRLVVVEGLLSRFEASAPSRSRSRATNERSSLLGVWEALPGHLVNLPETTDLVFVDGPLSRNNRLLTRVASLADVRTFPAPNPADLRGWISGRAAEKGAEIDRDAVSTLAETVGGNLQTLDAELEKLATYRAGQAIRREDVEELVSYTKEANIFATVDAMIEGRTGPAIRQAHQLLDAGRPAVYLLTMIARQVRLLLLAKELRAQKVPQAEMGSRLGLSGYPLRKTLDQERRFTMEGLTHIHGKLLESDISIKTTGADEQLVLDLLIAEISSVQGRRQAAGRS